MGRRHYIIISAAIALSIFASGFSFGQGQKQGAHGPRSNGFNRRNNEFRATPDRLNQLSPEERQRFRQNAERWLQMGPEERDLLRQREKMRRERLKSEAEAAMRDLDLSLDQKARAQFEARYLQERRRMEHALRNEIEAKRQQELPQLNERLKSEFQPNQTSPASSTSPAGSAKPAASTKPGGR